MILVTVLCDSDPCRCTLPPPIFSVGRPPPRFYTGKREQSAPAWHSLYRAIVMRVASVGDRADTKRRRTGESATPKKENNMKKARRLLWFVTLHPKGYYKLTSPESLFFKSLTTLRTSLSIDSAGMWMKCQSSPITRLM